VIGEIEGLHTDETVALSALTTCSGFTEDTEVLFVSGGSPTPGGEAPGLFGIIVGIRLTIAECIESCGLLEILGSPYKDLETVEEFYRKKESSGSGHSEKGREEGIDEEGCW
jgi:hypothetical protein